MSVAVRARKIHIAFLDFFPAYLVTLLILLFNSIHSQSCTPMAVLVKVVYLGNGRILGGFYMDSFFSRIRGKKTTDTAILTHGDEFL